MTHDPWYSSGGVEIRVGHVLDVLAWLEAGSVQCVVTSPPYYGLRSYSTTPQIWGGSPDCDHTLEETAPGKVLTGGTGTASAKQVTNAGSQYGNAWGEFDQTGQAPSNHEHQGQRVGTFRNGAAYIDQPAFRPGGATCTRCKAWRGELGSEPNPQMYVEHIVEVFRAVRRVLHDTGTIWINLGDSYSGSGKGPTGHNGIGDQGQRQGFVDQRSDVPGLGPKQLLMMPARVALALQADGWTLRQQIIWAKPNPMPESVTDRCTTSHEYVYLLAKNPRYFFDAEAIKERSIHAGEVVVLGEKSLSRGQANGAGIAPSGNGNADTVTVTENRNRRSVWTIPTESFPGAHFATFPRKMVEPCVLSGTSARGCCSACLAPYERVVERGGPDKPNLHSRSDTVLDAAGSPMARNGSHNSGLATAQMGSHWQFTTTGWRSTCRCEGADVIPCTVLDCFAGSGTSLWVARHHSRRAVGIELNEEYARLAAERLRQGTLGLEVW